MMGFMRSSPALPIPWLLAGLGLLVVALVVVYNRFVALRMLVRNAWADVDVTLKRRADLVPNLVEAVRAYASFERSVLTEVTEARAKALASGGTQARADAESDLSSHVARLVAIAESYPDLKASEGFLNLQRELSDTERHLASARQYYNACVRDFNTKIESFPSNVVAGLMGLRHEPFFEVETSSERHAPGVRGLA
jgi:LemA protein